MVSNAAYATYSIQAKRVLHALPQLTPSSMYAVLALCACIAILPVALAMELMGAGTAYFANGRSTLSRPWLFALLAFTGCMQYLSNEIAFCTLSLIHPVTYAVANTLKRSIVVAVSLVFFGQRLRLSGAIGAALALVGALMYSLARAGVCKQDHVVGSTVLQ